MPEVIFEPSSQLLQQMRALRFRDCQPQRFAIIGFGDDQGRAVRRDQTNSWNVRGFSQATGLRTMHARPADAVECDYSLGLYWRLR